VPQAGRDVEGAEGDDDDEEVSDEAPEVKPERELRRTFDGKVKFTSQDQRFLRALKISVEEDPRA
jgi:hypothetical protein